MWSVVVAVNGIVVWAWATRRLEWPATPRGRWGAAVAAVIAEGFLLRGFATRLTMVVMSLLVAAAVSFGVVRSRLRSGHAWAAIRDLHRMPWMSEFLEVDAKAWRVLTHPTVKAAAKVHEAAERFLSVVEVLSQWGVPFVDRAESTAQLALRAAEHGASRAGPLAARDVAETAKTKRQLGVLAAQLGNVAARLDAARDAVTATSVRTTGEVPPALNEELTTLEGLARDVLDAFEELESGEDGEKA